jgi:glutamate-ammonia-ligase adenylyltransferase
MPADAPLSSLVRFAPKPADLRAGERALAAIGATDAPDFVAGVAGCSPYLARLIERDPEAARLALGSSPEASVTRAIAAAWKAAGEADPALQMRALRRAKADAALSIALAEISGAATTMESAARLSRFADAAVGAAVRMALRQTERLGFRALAPERPEEGSGFTVLAMGKHGAFELNYSSDIDLVVLFDSGGEALGAEAKKVAVAAARAMVSRLNDQTADGYVFRTDLRLRPDPGVSAAAVSTNAAETYYESYGQNWERAAFIKARAAAGDIPLGEEFIRRLRPFIWRKYLDFAAIEEVHAVMRQIHAGAGAGEPDFFGCDLKRGRGGIREIEFFVQAQQLIGGGKNPSLRPRATLEAMAALTAAGALGPETAAALRERYCYLRTVEHRLQMIADEQTHRIPINEDEATRLAVFLGEESLAAFEAKLTEVLRSTHELAAPLFRPEEKRPADARSFNFTGVDNDPDTIAALEALGFERPAQVADAFRRWHAGETRATRSTRARALLGKITPELIEALARARSPDDAFAAFDGFLRSLPSGVQIFSLFLNRPDVFDHLIRIMTVSPYLARKVAQRAHLAESLIESRWPEAALSAEELAGRLAARLSAADDYESALNGVRRWASEESFSTSAQLLTELIRPDDAAARFTAIADASLEALLAISIAETERLHGKIDGAIAVIGLGRLGARQMTAASDVDLIFVYDAPEGARASGEARLDAVTYFARLVRRYLAAVTTPTEEGVLYEADMQLRPSGAKGPAAVSLSAFRLYYEKDAWTFEKMALTKARVIAGDAALGRRVAAEIAAIIDRPREAASCARDVDAMRERLLTAKPAIGPFDLKTAVGGFVEIDFTVQYLVLTHPRLVAEEIRSDLAASLAALEAGGALGASEASILRRASNVFEAAHQMSRAATGGVFAPGAAGDAVRRLMAAIFGRADLESAEAELIRLEQSVRSVYEGVVLGAKGGVA